VSRDDGTVLPLVLMGVLLTVTLLAATTATGAALVARRRLAATCDAAALAAATTLTRDSLLGTGADDSTGGDPDGTGGSTAGPGLGTGDSTGGGPEGLGTGTGTGYAGSRSDGDRSDGDRSDGDRSDGDGADRLSTRDGRRSTVDTRGADVRIDVEDGTVVARCRARTAVPFGSVIGRPDGIGRTATSRARLVLRPST
jgi:hypothetical protein